ncbi:unnamed protein product [Prorocentrum cordatum]|uniref:Uncharacterized protein n=1 Tax=Prorocentrum cordatum TaxID=2364126 RepID=A0ABN9VLE5_9DINO|nr:unnamed protein product [Polarella glacialis]CAK0872968.1 unnamed protein product [Polarella glacialis]
MAYTLGVAMPFVFASVVGAEMQLIQTSARGLVEDFMHSGGRPVETPEPTMEPGVPCSCNVTCGSFPYYDTDGSGCLELPEVEAVDGLAGKMEVWDLDGDNCLNQTECEASDLPPSNPPVPVPSPCTTCAEWLQPGTSVCQSCTGETRRRRADSCTTCETGKFAVQACDNCMEDDAMYLNASAEVGHTRIYVNKNTDLGGFSPTVGDSITISKCCCESASDHGTFVITGAAPSTPAISFDIPALTMDFSEYDRVTKTCSSTDGVGYPSFFPCGCGSEICGESTKCDITGAGGCGTCIPTTLPTPAPTVSAKGDPHLVNLNGEHFDVNHGGEFTLLRIPQNTIKPAEVELKASILPEHGKPCTTYITEVEISGSWLGGKVVQVRSYLRSHVKNETDKFLGLRVLDRTLGAVADEAPWQKLSQWADTSYVVSEPQSKDGFEVSLSTAKWHSKKDAFGDVPTVAGQVEIQMTNKWLASEPTKLVIRQDLPRQEHLNLAVRRLSSLGRADVGGLLGFDEHPESLEDVTPECQRHRDGLDQKAGPRHSMPDWKVRWEKIKEQRMQPRHTDSLNDNEAAASLASRDMMCVCPGDASGGLEDDEYIEGLLGGDNIGGVLVEFQTGRLAEATWD